MTILRAVLAELFGMFVADLGMTAAVLLVVAGAGVIVALTAPPHLYGMAVLVLGTLAVPIGFAWAYARRNAKRQR